MKIYIDLRLDAVIGYLGGFHNNGTHLIVSDVSFTALSFTDVQFPPLFRINCK